MSTPSLLNIPYVIKAGTLYSQIPETGAGDFVVTRVTTPTANRSTRVNANGLLEFVNDNVPRLDYPVGGAVNGCPALLVEPAATNLVPNGLSYNAVTGVLYDTTVTDSPATGINSARATKNEGAGNNRYPSQIFSAIALSANTAYTVSRFFKFDGHTFATSLEASSSAQWGNVTWNQVINLASTGVTLGTSTNCTGSVENYGNGWFRVSVRVTTGATISGATTVNVLSILPSALSTGQGFLASLPQLETGSVPTSYIHTTTQAIARGSDVMRKTGITSLLGQSEGTVYFEVEVTDEARNKWFCTLDSASNSFIQMWVNPSRQISAQINNSGTIVVSVLTSSVLTLGYHKVAFAYNTATNGCIMYVDGVQNPATTRTVGSPGLPAFNDMRFGGYITGTTESIKGHVRAGAVYPNRLSNSELAALTTP
jgi:hypothetical protein